jgi:hypothetical protein
MGSAFSIFAANCLYSTLPKGTISAFATHSSEPASTNAASAWRRACPRILL